MPRDTRPIRLAEGQTDLGWDPVLTEPDPAVIYRCRSCLSTHTAGPIRRTVDPRWVHATCLDCGERVIADVVNRPTPSQHTEDQT